MVDWLSAWGLADPGAVVRHLADLGLAFLLALPIGLYNERHERSAGRRTFPLVAMAACGFVIVAVSVLGRESEAQGRVMEGLITGVGFIGGGAILKYRGHADGTATASGLWVTGAIGAAVGYGLFDIAAILAFAAFLTMRGLKPIKKFAQRDPADAAETPR